MVVVVLWILSLAPAKSTRLGKLDRTSQDGAPLSQDGPHTDNFNIYISQKHGGIDFIRPFFLSRIDPNHIRPPVQV